MHGSNICFEIYKHASAHTEAIYFISSQQSRLKIRKNKFAIATTAANMIPRDKTLSQLLKPTQRKIKSIPYLSRFPLKL